MASFGKTRGENATPIKSTGSFNKDTATVARSRSISSAISQARTSPRESIDGDFPSSESRERPPPPPDIFVPALMDHTTDSPSTDLIDPDTKQPPTYSSSSSLFSRSMSETPVTSRRMSSRLNGVAEPLVSSHAEESMKHLVDALDLAFTKHEKTLGAILSKHVAKTEDTVKSILQIKEADETKQLQEKVTVLQAKMRKLEDDVACESAKARECQSRADQAERANKDLLTHLRNSTILQVAVLAAVVITKVLRF